MEPRLNNVEKSEHVSHPADTKEAEETNCDNLLDFWEDIPVAIASGKNNVRVAN